MTYPTLYTEPHSLVWSEVREYVSVFGTYPLLPILRDMCCVWFRATILILVRAEEGMLWM